MGRADSLKSNGTMIKLSCRRTSQSRSGSSSRSGSPEALRQRSEYITEFKASKGRSQAHGSAGSAPHDLSAPKRSVTRLSILPACNSSSAATLLTRNTAQCCFLKPQSSVADSGFQQPERLGSTHPPKTEDAHPACNAKRHQRWLAAACDCVLQRKSTECALLQTALPT